jgi:ketosteroid isomerase-like protein
MSQQLVETFKRGTEAINRGDVEAMLEGFDPEIEYYAALPVLLGGAAAVVHGHAGVRELFRDLYDVLDEIQVEYPEVRDLGDRILAIGRLRTRGKGSGAETESPFCTVIDAKDGKAIRLRSYLDPKEALEAAGLRE